MALAQILLKKKRRKTNYYAGVNPHLLLEPHVDFLLGVHGIYHNNRQTRKAHFNPMFFPMVLKEWL
jgi:hypothetical protein